MGRIRNAFTAGEKLRAVAYAEAQGNRAAGREFTISEANIRQWRKQKDRLQKLPKQKKAERGSTAHHPELETQLLAWTLDVRQQGIGLTTTEIRIKAKILAEQMAIINFKASMSWTYKYLRRNDLSIRRRTHISQRLPEDYDDKLLEFQRFIINQRKLHNFDLSQIGNADQTPLTFDLPYATSIDRKGAKTVNITTTGNEKNHFTVMLACTADGGKLPPYVIFKRKTMPKDKFPDGVIVRVQQNGWMDEALTKDWVKAVWQRRPGGLRQKSLLVLDAFRCHKSEPTKRQLRSCKTTLSIIPGGMTSILQPLDVSVNKPMKSALRKMWTQWMMEGTHTYTPSGLRRKPELPLICEWILTAWQELDPAIIVRAFKKCCISNAMDGTEDDILFEDVVQQNAPTAAAPDAESDDDDDDDDDYDDLFYADVECPWSRETILDVLDSDTDTEDFDGFDPVSV